MAYKSLLLSLALTVVVGYTFTAGLTSPGSYLKKLPEWSTIPMIVGIFLLYLLASWWAFKGFEAHKTVAFFSLFLCVLGFGIYLFGFATELGRGKAAPGQYDYDFSRLDPEEKSILIQMAQNAGLSLQDATFTEHWHVAENTPGFRVCVQKGHITALNFSGKSVPDPGAFSKFNQLGDLYLNNCGLKDLSALHAEKIERLELADNQLTDVKTLAGCPNLRWLVLRNNRLQTTEGLEQFTGLVSNDLSGNPLRH